MDPALVSAHVRAIDAGNQRGGRMLTLVDLIEAGTVDLPLAAYLASTMRTGASLLVGAVPGGAGKTTVMCALLNFLPDHTVIHPIESPASLRVDPRDSSPGATCYLAHEIGSGSYYAYIWGETARAFFALAAQGHTVASNLHADTLDQTRDQLCRQNGVEEAHLSAITLKLFIGTARGDGWDIQRWVNRVYGVGRLPESAQGAQHPQHTRGAAGVGSPLRVLAWGAGCEQLHPTAMHMSETSSARLVSA